MLNDRAAILLSGFLAGLCTGASIYWLVQRDRDLQELEGFVDVDDEFEALFNGDDSDFVREE